MRHRPVVTNFRVRPVTYPDGHWMNRLWGPLARGLLAVVGNMPLYRYVLRAHPAATEVLDRGGPVVFACVHQDALDCFNGLPRILQDRPLAAMVSYSRDGGLAAMGLAMLGFEVIRGSSSRGGGEGLLMVRSMLTSGVSAVMVCDGPKAPLGDVKPGVIHLAASTGVPILPVRAWGAGRWRFERSWTRAAVSLPFCPVVVCLGAPLSVPVHVEDPRPFQLALANAIADLARFASRWAGGPGVAPFETTSA